jgi:uncharacterized repeat protein (TIGR01451 family)
VALASVLWVTLASIPAFGQLTPTTLDVTAVRAPTELVVAADGGLLDLITYGLTATFNVRVTNTGASRAYAVKLTGAAPTGPTVNSDGGLTTRITAVTPTASCRISDDSATFSCNVGDLPDGQLADGGFLAAASASGTFTITLSLPSRPFGTTCTLADGGIVPGNSLGPITLTAIADNGDAGLTFTPDTKTRALADLAVTLMGPDSANEGDTVTYQVHGVNNGPCVANRVRLTNSTSAGLHFQFNSAGGACEGDAGYPCTVASSWPAGASIDVTSTYTVDNLPAGIVSTKMYNQVDLNSNSTANPDGGSIPVLFATPDPTTSNNTANKTTAVAHPSGCNSVTGSTFGLFGIALIILILGHRRRKSHGG